LYSQIMLTSLLMKSNAYHEKEEQSD
jgi:hypothetical protein